MVGKVELTERISFNFKLSINGKTSFSIAQTMSSEVPEVFQYDPNQKNYIQQIRIINPIMFYSITKEAYLFMQIKQSFNLLNAKFLNLSHGLAFTATIKMKQCAVHTKTFRGIFSIFCFFMTMIFKSTTVQYDKSYR